MPKYFLLPLGCAMNQSDTQRIQSVLEEMGYQATDDEEQASLLGMVACSVRQKAIDKVYSKIHTWNKRKVKETVLTFVSGCILPADEQKFLKLFDLVFRVNDLAQLPERIRQYGVAYPNPFYEVPSEAEDPLRGFWNIKPRYQSSFEAHIPIQNGCDKFCTFCAVPFTRGREVSRPSEDILQEIELLLQRGYKSLWLLGQNVNSYGQDNPTERSFAQLLEAIGQMGQRTAHPFWVYFTSPHPRDMNVDVLEVMARYPVLAKWIHLPMQSGNDKILIKMNRNHSIQRYRQLVHDIRRILPEATLFTDIIVGFCGETDEQFEDTKKAFEEFKFNMAYIAQYSPRPGAASYRWKDDVLLATKESRFRELTELLQKTSGTYNQELLGKSLRILVEGSARRDGYLTGRSQGRLIVRFPYPDTSLVGTFCSIKITSVQALSLEGVLDE